MKKPKSTILMYLAVLFLVFFQTNTALSQSKAAQKAGSGSTSFEYRYPSAEPVHYLSTQNVLQLMDVNGEQMQVTVKSVHGFLVRSSGNIGKNLKIEINVDTMAQTVETPQGMMGGEMADAKGKTFNIVITPQGKQVDISEAASIKIGTGDGRSTNLSQSISGFFPVLPAGQVQPGYSWPSTDTTNFISEAISMNEVVRANNTFDGYENVQGIDCARITSTMEGTWSMKNQAQGMDMNLTGTFTGTGTAYFAPSKGYFVKNAGTMKLKGTIEMSSPQSMTLPVTMDISSESVLQR